MTTLFEYPRTAAFGRVLPKSKIYEHGNFRAATKELFVKQVEKIVWQYKLAPETIHLKGTPSIQEIQVFSIFLKEEELKSEVMRCIDQAIPFPLFFELCFDDKVKPVAAFKRTSEADSTKWVVSDYFEGEWVPANTPRNPLPMVLDLEALYGYLLMSFVPSYPARLGEGVQEWVARMEQIRLKQRELERCEVRLHKEKQFNRKVGINAELRGLKQELEELTWKN